MQLSAIRDDRDRYAAAGITVWAINNQSQSSHDAFAAKHGFTAPLLVDRDFSVAKAYDATLGLGPLRVVNRTVAGIGRDGRIVFYRRGMPSTNEILAAYDNTRPTDDRSASSSSR